MTATMYTIFLDVLFLWVTVASSERKQSPALGRARFASEEGAPNEDRTDPPPANHMLNWLFKYYVTALCWGSATPPW